MARIGIFRGDTPHSQVEISDRVLRVGRGKENDIVLEDPGKAVSRVHAELRFRDGRYVLEDLNSQNGIWANGRRLKEIILEPDVPVTVGPYRLILEETRPAGEASDTKGPAAPGTPAIDPLRTADTLAAPEKVAPRKKGKAEGAKPGQAPIQPGPIAWLARQPKPLVFGTFAVVVIFVMLLGQLRAPSGARKTRGERPSSKAGGQTPRETNEQIVARHLREGKAQMAAGNFEAAISDFERILLIPGDHAEALEQKARAEEEIHKRQAPRVVDIGPPPPRPPPQKEEKGGPEPQPKSVGKGVEGGGRPMPPPEQPKVVRRPGESLSAWRARDRAAEARYVQAKTALARGEVPVAVRGLEALEQEEPGYRDAPALLEQARERLREQLRASAQQALDAGAKLEASGDWIGALQQYELAQQVDASLAGLGDAIRRLRDRMKAGGEEAFKRARVYDALGRAADAIPLYRRALQLLPPEDPNRKVAKARLDALSAGIK